MKICEEMDKLKKMPSGDRLWYIWEYYKVRILATFFLLFFLFSFFSSLIGGKEVVLTIYSINNPIYEEEAALIQKGFIEYASLNEEKQKVEIDGMVIIDTENPMSFGSEYITKIVASMAAKELDGMLMDASASAYYSGLSAFKDLSELLPESFLFEHEGRLQHYENEDGISRPYVIDVGDSPVLKQAGFSGQPVYFGIIANSPNDERAAFFLEYLLVHGD